MADNKKERVIRCILEDKREKTGSSGNKKKEEESLKPKWQRFLESTGGTAIITVLLGGLLGQIINSSIQKGIKEREFQQEWMKARGDQALASYNQYLNQENEIVQRTFELVGTCMSAAADLITLTSAEFAPGSHANIEVQRTAIREKYNQVDAQWRSECHKLGLLMSYYHRGEEKVVKAWEEVQDALSNYMDCARKWYLQHYRNPVDISQACENEEVLLKERLVVLTKSLEESREYAWEGWESPDEMRATLEKKK